MLLRLLVLLSALVACRHESHVAAAKLSPTVSASPNALTSAAPPVTAPSGPLLDIVTTGEGGCVLRRDGRVACWKLEAAGRTLVAKDLAGLTDIVSVSGSDKEIKFVRRTGEAGAYPLAYGINHKTLPLAGVAQVADRCVRLQSGTVTCDCLSGWIALPFVSSAVDPSLRSPPESKWSFGTQSRMR